MKNRQQLIFLKKENSIFTFTLVTSSKRTVWEPLTNCHSASSRTCFRGHIRGIRDVMATSILTPLTLMSCLDLNNYRIYFDFFFHKSENIGLWQSRMSPVAREINIYFQSELESLGNELIQLVTVGLRLKASCILPDLTHGGFETFGPI